MLRSVAGLVVALAICSADRSVTAHHSFAAQYDRDKPVTVRADGRATHQSVVSAMDVLGKLGFVRLNIATVEESPAKK